MAAELKDIPVSERPIIFSGTMVNAILKGRKTQTRRVVKPQPERDPFPCHWVRSGWSLSDPWEHGVACTCREIKFPYASAEPTVRELLWVREALRWTDWWVYDADKTYVDPDRVPKKVKPSRAYLTPFLMPRWASRITLEITNIRIERLMDISDADIRAEGVDVVDDGTGNVRAAWANGWNAINEKRGYSWLHNPWVWVIEFKKATTA